jgi:Right handed beta helix region
MKHNLLSILAISLFSLLHIDPAAAQATRTWVSGVGDDVNPCSRTAPCKTFAGAISKTATGGEINCIDPGGFGAVTITKSITISCPSTGTAGILAAGVNGVIVSNTIAANSEVLLEGLDIEGNANGTSAGIHGVNILGAARVTIQRCSIRNFSQSGVNLAGPAGARVLIQDSIILSNNNGLLIAGNGGGSNVGILVRTTVDNHPGTAIVVIPGNTLIMSGSKVLGSATSVSGGGTFTSFGDNAIQTTGTPTNTIPLR